MNVTICAACKAEFTPKPMGYNARYCSKTCKGRIRYDKVKTDTPEKLSEWRRKSYQNDKQSPERMERRRKEGRASVKSVRVWLAEYKLSIGCVDCGFKGHYAALQLDHEGTKSISIAHARSSVARLQKEITDGECKVRCANCHAIKTWERKQEKLK